MAGFVVIVTGWRGATPERHQPLIADPLSNIQAQYGGDVLLRHGRCPYGGVDLIAHNLATGYGWTIDEWPPEVRDGRILGSPRNRAMCAADPRAHLVLAFPGPGSRGTWDCLRWAQRYDIPFRGVPLQLSREEPS